MPARARRPRVGAVAPSASALGQLASSTPLAPLPASGRSAPSGADALDDDDDIDVVDAVDPELFPIFEEEAQELLPQLGGAAARLGRASPDDGARRAACMRTLHTLKGGARLAGAMRLGEMAHRLETAIERLLAPKAAVQPRTSRRCSRSDALTHAFEALRSRDAQAYADAVAARRTGRAASGRRAPAPTPLRRRSRAAVVRAVGDAAAPPSRRRGRRAAARPRAAPAEAATEPRRAPACPQPRRRDRLVALRRRRAGARRPAGRPALRAIGGARALAAARPAGQPGRRGDDHALAPRGRARPDARARSPT